MPARKSCASLIIGDLDVLPIAVSTSFSIAARLPQTISSSTGSAGPRDPSVSIGTVIGSLQPEQQIAEPVDARHEPWMHRDRRAVLLDDGGTCHLVPGCELRPPVDR